MTYDELVDKLNKAMREEYVAVHPTQNPIASTLKDLCDEEIIYVIEQYSLFPKSIVSFLQATRDNSRAARWSEVDAKLTRNMGEKLGTETDGKTHYQILVEGLENELGVHVREVACSPATHTFVEGIRKSVGTQDIPYAIGAAYALESSAVPELEIVLEVVQTLSRMEQGRTLQPDGTLKRFFDMHLGTWEPGHEDKLRKAASEYVKTPDQCRAFEQGFRAVMGIMDMWWYGMQNESILTLWSRHYREFKSRPKP